MKKNLIIESPDDLLDLLEKPDYSITDIQQAQFGKGFVFHIKVRGEGWDGLMDYKVAHLVLDLQRDILNIYNEALSQKNTFRNKEVLDLLRVTVTIEKGSTELYALLSDVFAQVVSKLKPSYIATVLIAGIAAWFGKEYIKSRHRKIVKIAESENEKLVRLAEIEGQMLQIEAQRQAIRDVTQMAIEMTDSNNRAMAYLARQMNKEDTVEIIVPAGGNITLNKKELMARLPAKLDKEEILTSNLQTWGKFKVIKTDNVIHIYTLTADQIRPFNARTSFINTEVQNKFFDLYAEQLSDDKTPEMLLKLSIEIDEDKNIQQALILEILDEEPTDKISLIQEIIHS